MSKLAFTAQINIHGINPYILVSEKRAVLLKSNWRKPMPVVVQINGKPDKPWHINMMPIGDGSFYLYLHEEVRKASGTKVGDRVKAEVSFDEEYRPGPQHKLSSWFKVSLSKNKKAKKAWDALIPSRQKEILRYFSGLKSKETRDRNLEKVLEVLSGKEGRFMARTWKDGK